MIVSFSFSHPPSDFIFPGNYFSVQIQDVVKNWLRLKSTIELGGEL